MFFNYLQKNVNTQKGIIPSCTKSFFTKGLLGGDNFLILLFRLTLHFSFFGSLPTEVCGKKAF